MRPEERLRFHQEHNGPVMEELHRWLEAQLAEKKTEPKSGLDKAITYLLRHWKGLTACLRQARAPLDNNIYERALKRTVLHRKKALFYKTLHGAELGDLFMSVIHTASSPASIVRLSDRGPASRAGTGRRCGGLDAVELSRDAGARAAVVISWFSNMAEKDRWRPWRGDAPKCPENGLLKRRNPTAFFGQPRRPAKMLRAGLYARVSTNDQQTLPMQIRALREYAARRGWTIAIQVREVGSGAVQRKARERLIEAARRREIDAVLVWRLDRWAVL